MHNMLGEIDVTYNGRMELSDYIQVMLSQLQKRIIAGNNRFTQNIYILITFFLAFVYVDADMFVNLISFFFFQINSFFLFSLLE